MTRHTTRQVTCDRCEGSGIVNDDEGFPVTCGTCVGAGVVHQDAMPVPATTARSA